MSTEAAPRRTRRLTAALRAGETVSPPELFFDLVLVRAVAATTTE